MCITSVFTFYNDETEIRNVNGPNTIFRIVPVESKPGGDNERFRPGANGLSRSRCHQRTGDGIKKK